MGIDQFPGISRLIYSSTIKISRSPKSKQQNWKKYFYMREMLSKTKKKNRKTALRPDCFAFLWHRKDFDPHLLMDRPPHLPPLNFHISACHHYLSEVRNFADSLSVIMRNKLGIIFFRVEMLVKTFDSPPGMP